MMLHAEDRPHWELSRNGNNNLFLVWQKIAISKRKVGDASWCSIRHFRFCSVASYCFRISFGELLVTEFVECICRELVNVPRQYSNGLRTETQKIFLKD